MRWPNKHGAEITPIFSYSFPKISLKFFSINWFSRQKFLSFCFSLLFSKYYSLWLVVYNPWKEPFFFEKCQIFGYKIQPQFIQSMLFEHWKSLDIKVFLNFQKLSYSYVFWNIFLFISIMRMTDVSKIGNPDSKCFNRYFN